MIPRALLLFALLAAVALDLVSCHVREPTAQEVAHDAAIGGTIGAATGVPGGSYIGAAIAVALGAVARSVEKGRLDRRHADDKVALARDLTERFADNMTRVVSATQTTNRYPPSEALTRNQPASDGPFPPGVVQPAKA